jgi:catechol 2,3-dioxygenase
MAGGLEYLSFMDGAIHPGTELGSVHLRVLELARARQFYTQGLGLRVLAEGSGSARLGSNGKTLLELEQTPGAPRPGRTAGLYHLALLLPSRLELARALDRLQQARLPVAGFADHLVSEAIYLTDPEGNGIELYRDRPRKRWVEKDGGLLMGTYPLDPEELLGELERAEGGSGAGGQAAGEAGALRLGHVHLQVSDLAASDRFYVQVLGFQLRLHYGSSASFVSAGGYHHHIGYNTWAGRLAAAPAEGALGLGWFSVVLPSARALQEVRKRVKRAQIPFREAGRALLVRDPSGIELVLEASTSAADRFVSYGTVP